MPSKAQFKSIVRAILIGLAIATTTSAIWGVATSDEVSATTEILLALMIATLAISLVFARETPAPPTS